MLETTRAMVVMVVIADRALRASRLEVLEADATITGVMVEARTPPINRSKKVFGALFDRLNMSDIVDIPSDQAMTLSLKSPVSLLIRVPIAIAPTWRDRIDNFAVKDDSFDALVCNFFLRKQVGITRSSSRECANPPNNQQQCKDDRYYRPNVSVGPVVKCNV